MSERLGLRDLKALQGCIAELYTLGNLAGYRRRLLDVLSAAVSGDVCIYSELDPRARRVAWSAETVAAFGWTEAPRVYAAHVDQLPLLKSYRRGEGSAVKISDFVSQREFHRTALYNEFYRRVGVKYHIAKGLPGLPGLVTSTSIFRKGVDFSERDRLMLNLLRPHLNQSYRNASVVSRMERDLALVHQGLDALAQGIVIVTRDGGVTLMSGRAGAWIRAYFGRTRDGALPDQLRRWVRQCDARIATDHDAPAPCTPLVMERDGRRLIIRLLCAGDRRVLLLTEHVSEPRPERLEMLGLSPREAEVLAWVAEGKTNAVIAAILGTSTRTIDKHLQHVFEKLGVETRTAAAARALSLDGVTASDRIL